MTAIRRRPWSNLRDHASSAVFWFALVVGLVLRVVITYSTAYRLDSDRSVVYLMARHVARGEYPAFYWGQSYGGAILPWAAGSAMAITSQSVQVLAFVSALFWAAAAVALRRLVAIGIGQGAGDLAGLLFWFPGSVLLTLSVADPGFYGPTILIGMWALLLAQGWRPDARGARWAALGAAAGLAVWTSPISVGFVAPAVICVLWTDRRWRWWLVALATAAITASPWIVETVSSRLQSVKPLGGSALHPESLASAFTAMIPAAFPLGGNELGAFAISLAAVAAIVGLIIVGIRRRSRTLLLIGCSAVLVLGVLVAGSGVRLAADSTRYTAFLLPAFAVAVAMAVNKWRLASWAVGVVAVIVTAVSIGTSGGYRVQVGYDPFDQGSSRVLRLLADRGIDRAYGSYWLAYPLTAQSSERITVAALGVRRYQPYERAAEGAVPEAIVVYRGLANDVILRSTAGLPPYRRLVSGTFAVYVFDAWFDPYSLPFQTL